MITKQQSERNEKEDGRVKKWISTMEIYEEVSHCEEIDELKEIINKYSPYYSRWRDYINDILLNNGLSYEKLGRICGFSKNTIRSWVSGNSVPKSREKFIKFGMGLRCSIHEMNFLLQRYGKYPKLYAKSLEDAICIYVISHYPKDENVHPYDMYLEMKEQYLERIRKKNKRRFQKHDDKTKDLEDQITNIQGEDDFTTFVNEHEVDFANSYYKLLDYIMAFVKVENAHTSYHGMLIGKGLDKGFDKMISKLKNWGEVPNRMRMIALGIHLNMSVVEMNRLLEYANMEKLCPKDKIECIIIFVLVNVEISKPYDIVHRNVLLAQFTKNQELKEQCDKLLEELVGLHNAEDIKEDLEWYIIDAMETLQIEDPEDDNEFLQYLSGN